jgi:Cu/Ag efflux protein CusF
MKKTVLDAPLLTRNRLTHPCAFIFMMCCVTALVGCGRSQGKKTFDFLKAEREVIESMKNEALKFPKPKPPSPPDYSEAHNAFQRSQINKAYRVASGQYFGSVIQYSQQVEKLVNEAETTISRLDSSGIGDDAVNLTKDYEQMLGDTVQQCVEVRAVLKLAQAELMENKQAELGSHLVSGALALAAVAFSAGALTPAALTAGAGTFFKGVSSDENRDSERNEELQSHYANLQKVVAELEHYRGEVVTKRSELVTAYRAKYPQYEWSSVLPSEVQAAEQTHISQYEQTAVQAQNAPAISAAPAPAPAPKPKRQQYTGIVTAIDAKAGSLIIKKGEESKTFKIGEKTKYSTIEKPKGAAAVTDIKVGDKITVHYVDEDGVLVAHSIGVPQSVKNKESAQ